MKTAFDFKFKNINGGELELSNFKGNTILVTNVASKCGFTNQYEGLQTLWEKYKKKKFVVIGVSSNDFNQELKTKEEVKKFCEVNFGINFPMTDITSVKGENKHELFKYLTNNSKRKGEISWNFEKFLVNSTGNVVARFRSGDSPLGGKVVSEIKKSLN